MRWVAFNMSTDFKEFKKGAKRTLPIAFSTAIFGLSVGVRAQAAGLTLTELSFMSCLVFASSSQAIAIELWKLPLPIFSIILTTLFVNIRYIPMGGALAHIFNELPKKKVFPSLFIMSNSSWVVTLEQEQFNQLTAQGHSQPHVSLSFFLGSAMTAYLNWCLSSILGYFVGPLIPHPERFGLDFTMTSTFIYIIVGTWRVNRRLAPWFTAAASSVVAARLLPGTLYIVVGALAGCAIAAIFDPTTTKAGGSKPCI